MVGQSARLLGPTRIDAKRPRVVFFVELQDFIEEAVPVRTELRGKANPLYQ